MIEKTNDLDKVIIDEYGDIESLPIERDKLREGYLAERFSYIYFSKNFKKYAFSILDKMKWEIPNTWPEMERKLDKYNIKMSKKKKILFFFFCTQRELTEMYLERRPGNLTALKHYFHISNDIWNSAMQISPEIREWWGRMEISLADIVEENLLRKIIEKQDVNAIKLYLEAKVRDRGYGKNELDININDNKLVIEIVKPDEDE